MLGEKCLGVICLHVIALNLVLVIDAEGKISQQIDCIISDNVFTPTFWGDHGYVYIPAEAVYAVFEIRQSANKENIDYASEKIKSVRNLRRTSAPYTGDGQNRPPKCPFRIVGGLMVREFSIQVGSIKRALKETNSIEDKKWMSF